MRGWPGGQQNWHEVCHEVRGRPTKFAAAPQNFGRRAQLVIITCKCNSSPHNFELQVSVVPISPYKNQIFWTRSRSNFWGRTINFAFWSPPNFRHKSHDFVEYSTISDAKYTISTKITRCPKFQFSTSPQNFDFQPHPKNSIFDLTPKIIHQNSSKIIQNSSQIVQNLIVASDSMIFKIKMNVMIQRDALESYDLVVTRV